MVRMTALFAALATIFASVWGAGTLAQTPPATARPVFQPGLADLMTMLVQPRHIKLGLGGQARNWEYAAFAVHELEETFEMIGTLTPKWRKFSIVEMMNLTKEPIEALEAAIKARDGKGFDAAYDRLTQSCNACHKGTDMGVIAIQVPKASPFPDQNFQPPKP